MKNESILNTIDDDLLSELATRRTLFRRAGRYGMGLALGSVPLALAGLAKNAFGQGIPQQVVDILNYALTLEYLEAEYYTKGVDAAGLIPEADRSVFVTIRDHENAHVEFLRQQLGAQAVDKPEFDFTAGGSFAPFSDYAQFKLLAQAFEDTGVRAYKGQAPNLVGFDTVLGAALSIHSVEARHAAMVRTMNGLQGWVPFEQPGVIPAAAPVYAGEDVTVQAGVDIVGVSGVTSEAATEAYDEPLSMDAVLQIAAPFIAS